MTIPTIDPLRTPPSSSDPANFDARADALFGEDLPALVAQINAATAAIPVEVTTVATAVAEVVGGSVGADAGFVSGAIAGQGGLGQRSYAGRSNEFDTTAANGGYSFSPLGGGTLTQVVGASLEANHPGVVAINSTATPGTGGGVVLGTALDGMRVRGGSRFEAVFKTAATLMGYSFRLGWFDSLSTSPPTDALVIEVVSGSATAVARANGASTSVTLGALGTSTWYHAVLDVNAAGTSAVINIYLDSGLLAFSATVAANLPTASGREVAAGFFAFNTDAVAVAPMVSIDWLWLGSAVALQRGAALPVLQGADRFSLLRNTAAPNATVPAHAIAPAGAEANIDLVLGAKGAGAVQAQVPDNAATGGNKRGAGAYDTQVTRVAASQVASGAGAALFGTQNATAAGAASVVVGGTGGTVSGQFSAAVGGNNAADRGLSGAVVEAHASQSGNSRTQSMRTILRASTNATTPVRLTADGGAATAANVNALENNSAQYFRIRVVQVTVNNQVKSWVGNVLLRRGAVASNTAIVGAPSLVSDFGDAALAGGSVAVSADTTLGALNFTVTPGVATDSRWAAHLEALDVAI